MKRLKNLSSKEKKIYDSIMSHFPKTNKSYAIDIAIQGGIRFQFICK